MRLDEIRKPKDPNKMDANYVPQTKEEVTKWIYDNVGMIKHWVTPDLEVDFTDLSATHGTLHMSSLKIKGKLPIKLRKVKGILNVSYNYLTSFENFPEEVEGIWANNNRFKSLVGVDTIKTITGSPHTRMGYSGGYGPKRRVQFDLSDNPKISSGGIGLLHIQGLTSVDLTKNEPGVGWETPPALQIIQKYIGRPEDIFDCQAELIDRGFEEYAKL